MKDTKRTTKTAAAPNWTAVIAEAAAAKAAQLQAQAGQAPQQAKG